MPPATAGTCYTGGTASSAQSTAERFREELDKLAESFSVGRAKDIPLPRSLSEHAAPPGLEVEYKEMEVQTDIQLGESTWIVTLGQSHAQQPRCEAEQKDQMAQASDNEGAADKQDVQREFNDERDEYDECDVLDDDNESATSCVLDVDCFECEAFKEPEDYEYDEAKLEEYGYKEPTLVPRDMNHAKKLRKKAAKLRRRNAISSPKSTMYINPPSRPAELAPTAGTSAAPGPKSDQSQLDKSPTLSPPTSLSPMQPSVTQTFGYIMLTAIVLSAAALATEVTDKDEFSDCDASIEEQPLMAAEKEKPRKSIGEKLRERIASMIRVRKGFTIDSGAADHVMPLGWLAWIIVTASLGSIGGVNFISANGAKIPNKGEQKVRFMTSEGTWATWIFQVAGINKPLVSVSKLIKDGWRVIFDEDRSYLLHKTTGHTIDLKCERGIFTVEAFVEPTAAIDSRSGFHRPA